MKGSKSEISSFSILKSTQSAHVTCETNFSGSMWIEDEIQLDVQLPDCRYSTSNLRMKMFCPKQFYQSELAARNGCEQCPSPHSTTLNINANNIESCVCNIGYYGTFGESCIQCPSHPGFNCSMHASKVPQIKPGEQEHLHPNYHIFDICVLQDTTSSLIRCISVDQVYKNVQQLRNAHLCMRVLVTQKEAALEMSCKYAQLILEYCNFN